ncbi:MAG: pyridoxamine 5'-phosphate oxidase family protein [Prochloraceae cyanobacterium]|nr:pyridoxamine 5'-phosphate oxidase family protein [Prochloraceae cyanobacterium]
MAKFYSELTPELQNFIQEQKIFFTATAPKEGRINLSPKGIDTLRCIDSKTVAYINLTGSGNETAAHLLENGRITIMFCSFSEKPLILRLYGKGRVIHPRDSEWKQLHLDLNLPTVPGERQIIVADIDSVQTSCGFAVPIYEFQQDREMLIEWAEKQGKQGVEKYWRSKNLKSIDGLPTKIIQE